MLTRKLSVFCNTRKIRDFIEKAQDDFLPKLLPIHEFENTLLYKDDFSKASQIERILLMQEAIKKTKKCQDLLYIKSELLAFLKNSEYIFSFFTELAKDKKSINDLRASDIYASYDEHLDILENLLENYEAALEEKKLYDEITLVKNYNINDVFLLQFDEIDLYIDGILSNFEWDILMQAKEFTKINLHIQSSLLNEKLIKKVSELFNLKLENYHNYKISMQDGKILEDKKLEVKGKILLKEFKQKSLQACFVFEKISSFIRAGIPAKDIFVLLPDESFAQILKSLDRTNMLNFAMGQSFQQSAFYIILENIILSLKEKNFPDFELYNYDEISLLLSFYEIGEAFYNEVQNLYFSQTLAYDKILNLLMQLAETLKISKEIKDKILIKLFDIETLILNQNLSNRDIFEILLMNLAQIKIDDVSGGEVSVIGILESRSLDMKAAIIVDFNDDLVPKRSINEMFLNSTIRAKAGLISYLDRENLQRFYYESIILKADVVAISYLKNEEKSPSRFLKYFSNKNHPLKVELIKDEEYSDEEYLNILKAYQPSESSFAHLQEIKAKHNILAQALSFTRFETFRTCKRAYYYKYILKLKEARAFRKANSGKEIGEVLHKALEFYFLDHKDENYFSYEAFAKLFRTLAKNYKISKLYQELWLERLKKFSFWQNQRFEEGYKIAHIELSLENTFHSFPLIGKLDRVDQNEDGFEIIDYKSSKNIENKTFQLEFYKALFPKDNVEAKFLELKNASLIEQSDKINEESFLAALEELREESKEEIIFSKTEKKELCKHCAYKVICRKDLSE